MFLKYIRNKFREYTNRFEPTRTVEIVRHIDDEVGGELEGMLVYPRNYAGEAPGVVICPGYTSAYRQVRSAAENIAARGYPVLAFEYREDGTEVAQNFFELYFSGGIAEDAVQDVLDRAAERIEEQEGSFWTDANHALDILIEASDDIGITVTDIGVVGFSLGGYIAATVQDPRIIARVSVNPFYYQKKDKPFQPDTLYVLGESDRLTPGEWNGEAMYEKAPDPKQKLLLDGGHFSLTDALGVLPQEHFSRSKKKETLNQIGDWLEEQFQAQG